VWTGGRAQIGASGATIGRSRGCDVVIADSDVSRRHAQIVGTGGGWAIRDLGSTNGLRVNGRAVGNEPVALGPGDRIEIGTVRAQFEVG
jgi:pSer/pThr/pTyr-binding forkhead associated (FHA) protein